MQHDVSDVREVMRMPSPAPAPQALAFDDGVLWMGSWETQKVYGMKGPQLEVFERANAPGRPVGMTGLGGSLRVVCSETSEDHRFIRRYIPGHGFVMNDQVECPEDTGSFLAYDGLHLWLSQRYKQRILELDARYETLMEIFTDAQIIGIVWVHGHLYLSTWHGKNGGCKIGRTNASGAKVEYLATLPFAGISLAHDGTRFLTNDVKASAIVAFTLPKDRRP